MGSCVSKQSSEYIAEMRSYEDACREDPNIQSFDATIQTRTVQVLNTVVAGVDIRSLSFDSLKEVTGGLLGMNQEVVSIILTYKKDIWNNPQLSELTEQYFENSLHMLDFCTALEKCLKRARDRQLIISVALQRFEEEEEEEQEEEEEGSSEIKNEKYSKTLEELKRFKIAEDPFSEEFFQILKTVQEQQLSMLMKLKLQNSKISKKLNSTKTWRKLSSIIFVTAVVSVFICSVVTAAIAAPAVAAAAAAAVQLGSMGKWFDSLWKRYQVMLEGQKELFSSMEVLTFIALSDLDSIQALVDMLETQIESVMRNSDFALGGEGMVKLGIEEIKKNMEMFMKSLEDLGEHASKCSEHITKGRTAILQKIIKHKK